MDTNVLRLHLPQSWGLLSPAMEWWPESGSTTSSPSRGPWKLGSDRQNQQTTSKPRAAFPPPNTIQHHLFHPYLTEHEEGRVEKQAGDKQALLNPPLRTGWFEFIPFFLILCSAPSYLTEAMG